MAACTTSPRIANGRSPHAYYEYITDALTQTSPVTETLYHGRSEFQQVDVVITEPFGKTLMLDSKTQSALYDEAVYHESLVHPAMLAHGRPQRVFIGLCTVSQ